MECQLETADLYPYVPRDIYENFFEWFLKHFWKFSREMEQQQVRLPIWGISQDCDSMADNTGMSVLETEIFIWKISQANLYHRERIVLPWCDLVRWKSAWSKQNWFSCKIFVRTWEKQAEEGGDQRIFPVVFDG